MENSKRGPKRPPKVTYERLAQHAKHCLTVEELAKEIGASRSYTRHYMTCCAPDLRAQIDANYDLVRTRFVRNRARIVAQELAAGQTWEQIGQALKLSKVGARSWCRRNVQAVRTAQQELKWKSRS
jgi:hypothetical protein